MANSVPYENDCEKATGGGDESDFADRGGEGC